MKSTLMSRHFFLNFAISESAISAFAWLHFLKSYFVFNSEFESTEKCFMNDFEIEEIAAMLFLITIVMFAKDFEMFVENFLIFAKNFYKFLIFAKSFCRFLSFLMIINVMNFWKFFRKHFDDCLKCLWKRLFDLKMNLHWRHWNKFKIVYKVIAFSSSSWLSCFQFSFLSA